VDFKIKKKVVWVICWMFVSVGVWMRPMMPSEYVAIAIDLSRVYGSDERMIRMTGAAVIAVAADVYRVERRWRRISIVDEPIRRLKNVGSGTGVVAVAAIWAVSVAIISAGPADVAA